MLHKVVLALALFQLVITGCNHDDGGNNGGGNGTPPPPPPEDRINISGRVLNNGEDWSVTATEYGADVIGTSSDVFISNTYSVSVPGNVEEGEFLPVVVAMNSGTYIEAADSASVALDVQDRVFVSFALDSTNTKHANISYLSTIAYGLADYKIQNNSDLAVVAFNTSNTEISDLVGYDFLETTYVDTTDSNNTFTDIDDVVFHSLIHATISQMTLDWSVQAGNAQRARPYTTVDFITTAYNDIKADGLLDGLGEGGAPLVIGFKSIDANTYRHELALALFRYQENSNNVTGFTKQELLGTAQFLNDSTHALFGLSDTVILDEGGPVITDFTPAEGSTVSGDAQFSANASDLTGLGQVQLLIDDVHYAYAFMPVTYPLVYSPTRDFFVPVFQPSGTSGTHTITIRVTNVYGTTNEVTNTVTFDNM